MKLAVLFRDTRAAGRIVAPQLKLFLASLRPPRFQAANMLARKRVFRPMLRSVLAHRAASASPDAGERKGAWRPISSAFKEICCCNKQSYQSTTAQAVKELDSIWRRIDLADLLSRRGLAAANGAVRKARRAVN
jgi:hypothetical protein